jgi:hypothetical protein
VGVWSSAQKENKFCRLNFLLTEVKTSSIGSKWLTELNQLPSAPAQDNEVKDPHGSERDSCCDGLPTAQCSHYQE